MGSKYEEEDLSKVRPISIAGRNSKINVDALVDPDMVPCSEHDRSMGRLSDMIPDVLAGSAIKRVAASLIEAKKAKRPIIWLLGAHVIKCGLSLYLRSLMREGFITSIAAAGAALIHDSELSFYGKTSEDVAAELSSGRFGMSKETSERFVDMLNYADGSGMGLGEGAGSYIIDSGAPYGNVSIFAGAFDKSIPATVHIAFGTDIVHQHPSFPARIAGELTMKDFRIFTKVVGEAFDRGVIIVFGSAVIMPEVFLKAVSINYNLDRTPKGITVAAFDMSHQYRVSENILRRPFPEGTQSYSITGHHELMLPILYRLLKEERS